MKFKIKTLLSLGIVSTLGICSTLPINALSQESSCKKVIYNNNCYEECLYITLNGKEYSTCVKTLNRLTNDLLNNKKSCYNKKSLCTKLETSNTSSNIPSNNQKNSVNYAKTNKENKNINTNNKIENKNESNSNLHNNKVNSENNTFTNYQKEVLNLVNKERSNRGLAPLKLNDSLSNVATIKSQDMIDKNYFDHTSPTYGSPSNMINKFGISYNSMGENIAMGQSSPEEVMNSWMNSPGHRKNILNPNFTELGVGVAKNNSTLYWTQMFIGK